MVLLIVVSSTLTVFLIVLIVAIVYVIKILKSVQRLSLKAENVAESVESAAATFERTASPLAVLRVIGNIIEQTTKIRKIKD